MGKNSEEGEIWMAEEVPEASLMQALLEKTGNRGKEKWHQILWDRHQFIAVCAGC